MIRKIGIVIIFILLVLPLYAQDFQKNPPPALGKPGNNFQNQARRIGRAYGLKEAQIDISNLNISDEEIAKIKLVLAKDQQRINEARQSVMDSQLTLGQLLVSQNPDMDSVRRTIKNSTDAEYTIRLIQVERNIEIRNILGDSRWVLLTRLTRVIEFVDNADNKNNQVKSDPRIIRIIDILRSLR